MQLKVTDQIHISFIQADTLRPGQLIKVTPEEGDALLKAHPDKFEHQPATDDDAPQAKAEPAPLNKMAAPPANKAAGKRKAK